MLITLTPLDSSDFYSEPSEEYNIKISLHICDKFSLEKNMVVIRVIMIQKGEVSLYMP
jgi:hypothetical protein